MERAARAGAVNGVQRGGSKVKVPSNVAELLRDLVSTFPDIEEVWLLGSRAEGTESAASDWDLLVFSGDRVTPEMVAPLERFSPEWFDVFFVNGDHFVRPWRRLKDGAVKDGWLSRWKWRRDANDPDRATYCANASKPNRTSGTKPAIRIWRGPGGWSPSASVATQR